MCSVIRASSADSGRLTQRGSGERSSNNEGLNSAWKLASFCFFAIVQGDNTIAVSQVQQQIRQPNRKTHARSSAHRAKNEVLQEKIETSGKTTCMTSTILQDERKDLKIIVPSKIIKINPTYPRARKVSCQSFSRILASGVP